MPARCARRITGEMWEIVNGAWNEMQKAELGSMPPDELSRFLQSVKETSLRFDGAAYRTMLRTDHFWFQRLGTFVERADNIARLLDVKYHVLLPEWEPVGGGLDYFQWSSILRAVSAHHLLPLGLSREHPAVAGRRLPHPAARAAALAHLLLRARSTSILDRLAEGYGRQGQAQRLARATYARLQNSETEDIFQSGLHEFLTDFIAENNRLGAAISRAVPVLIRELPCASACATRRLTATARRRAPPCSFCA